MPGETRFSGWNLTGTVKDRGNKPLKEKTDETSAVLTNNGTWLPESNLTAYLDLDKTGNELRIRSRRTGDRFQPLGMKYSKKLAQFMIDVRIPLAWRQGIPIICSDEQIIWVAGYRIDERVKVTKRTKRILCLKFRPNPENSSS